MNKFFKFLGIGTAIGTVVYGVIKYKHDEKFKEKVDNVVDKAEEKADAALCKVSDFVSKHPGLFTVGFVAVTTIPCVIHAISTDRRRAEMMQRAYEDFRNDTDEECDRINQTAIEAAKQKISEHYGDDNVDLSNYLVVPKSDYEKYQKAYESTSKDDSGWREEYRDSFDEVTELSKRITLHPGESYMIEEPRQFGLDTDQPVVSHLINGTGCYPPEVKNDQFID